MNKNILFFFFLSLSQSVESKCANPILHPVTSDLQRDLLCQDSEFKIRSNVTQNGVGDEYFECVEFISLYSQDNVNIFVEKEQYDIGNVSNLALESIYNHFIHSTPLAEKSEYKNGIKNFSEFFFGLPPNKDGSDEVNILILDIRDNYSSSNKNYIAGYFDRNDQTDNATSNQKDIVYIDCYPTNMIENYPEEALFTLAHEYQHLLHYNSDPNEIIENNRFNPWLDEGLADLSPSILGFGNRQYGYFLSNTSIGLDQWINNGLEYYAKSALFIRYLYELDYLGSSFIKNIFEDDNYQRLESIKYWIETFYGLEFNSIFKDWVTSTSLDMYPKTQCISDVSKNVEINKNFNIYESPQIPSYSFFNILIPNHLNELEYLSNQSYDNVFIYNCTNKIKLDETYSNFWIFSDTSHKYDHIYTFINDNEYSKSNIINYEFKDTFSLNKLSYGQSVDNYISFDPEIWYAGIEFLIDTSAMLTSVDFSTSNDNLVNIKISKGGIFYTPQIDITKCSSTGNGMTRVNISEKNIYVKDEYVYVIIGMNENAMGFSDNLNSMNSYYSLDGNNFTRLEDFQSMNLIGNWVIELSYIDTNYVSYLDTVEAKYIYPNPYNLFLDSYLETIIYVDKHLRYNIEIFNSLGQRINKIYDGYPPIDQELKVKWNGKDFSGNNVSSGTYFLLHSASNDRKKYKFTVIK